MDSRALNPGGKFTGYWAGLMIRTLQTLSGRSGAAPCGMDVDRWRPGLEVGNDRTSECRHCVAEL